MPNHFHRVVETPPPKTATMDGGGSQNAAQGGDEAGETEKVTLAAQLRAETPLTVRWIAERLAMGTRGHLNQLLYRMRQIGGKELFSRTDSFTPFPRVTGRVKKTGTLTWPASPAVPVSPETKDSLARLSPLAANLEFPTTDGRKLVLSRYTQPQAP